MFCRQLSFRSLLVIVFSNTNTHSDSYYLLMLSFTRWRGVGPSPGMSKHYRANLKAIWQTQTQRAGPHPAILLRQYLIIFTCQLASAGKQSSALHSVLCCEILLSSYRAAVPTNFYVHPNSSIYAQNWDKIFYSFFTTSPRNIESVTNVSFVKLFFLAIHQSSWHHDNALKPQYFTPFVPQVIDSLKRYNVTKYKIQAHIRMSC